MKRLILSLTLVLLLVGCARRKEIDDKTLAQIFRDAYLTNAYLGVDYMELDSIQIYEPILESYGFTPEDLRYTIGNFSRRKSAQLGRVLKDAEEQIKELEMQMYSREEFRKHMGAIRSTLEMARRDAATGMITAEFVNKYIDKIFVTPEEDGTLRLDIKIFTGEVTQKYLAKLRSRAGQMSKNNCPVRTREFTRHNRIAAGHIQTVRYVIGLMA